MILNHYQVTHDLIWLFWYRYICLTCVLPRLASFYLGSLHFLTGAWWHGALLFQLACVPVGRSQAIRVSQSPKQSLYVASQFTEVSRQIRSFGSYWFSKVWEYVLIRLLNRLFCYLFCQISSSVVVVVNWSHMSVKCASHLWNDLCFWLLVGR